MKISGTGYVLIPAHMQRLKTIIFHMSCNAIVHFVRHIFFIMSMYKHERNHFAYPKLL